MMSAGTPSNKNRAVFLDRDGVINKSVVRDGKPYPPATLEAFELLPGVAQAVIALRQSGFKLIVVTNQPDVATGIQKREIVDAMHGKMKNLLELDEVKVCFHVDKDACACRKPKPGMLLEAAATWSIDLEKSFMVGDRWRDIDAGRAAGCKTLLVESDYKEREAENPDWRVRSLLEASQIILKNAQ